MKKTFYVPFYAIPYEKNDPILFHVLTNLKYRGEEDDVWNIAQEMYYKNVHLLSRRGRVEYDIQTDVSLIEQIDIVADDDKYIFFSISCPIQAHRQSTPTVGFYLSTLQQYGEIYYRDKDLYSEYSDVWWNIASDMDRLDSTHPKYTKVVKAIKDVAKEKTISGREAELKIKEYNKTFNGVDFKKQPPEMLMYSPRGIPLGAADFTNFLVPDDTLTLHPVTSS